MAKAPFMSWKFSHREFFRFILKCPEFNADDSITFTYGGVSIDSRGQALTRDKTVIPGLLVAGVDAGGFSNFGYAGGLALAFVTGLWSARTMAHDLGLPQTCLPAANPSDASPLHGRL
jgi:flavin-dependent dehydrogenase